MKRLVLLACGFSFFLASLSGQDTIIFPKSIFEVLQHSDVVKVTIETNLDSLINIRKRENYQAANFTYLDKFGKKITKRLKLKPRGKFRRIICDVPPIKLNFSKKELKVSGMAKFDDYKLVTHCINDKRESEENVLREYLIYKMYNVLSENSFRVQYLKITYIDSKKKMKRLIRSGFLIEDTQELADRIGAKIYSEPRLPLDSFNLEQYNFVALFQYMIGNVDWKASPFAKNVKVMKYEDKDTYELIPYDFDFSGVVETSYQRLAENLNQKSPRHRIFLGNLANQGELEKTFKLYESKKEALFNCINDFDLLPKSSRKNIRKYINFFYEDIADGTVETIN